MTRILKAHQRRILAVAIVSVTGWLTLGSYPLRSWGMDVLFRLRSMASRPQPAATDGIRIVYLDVATMTNSKPYVRLLDDLTTWKARAVVFDIVFTNQFWNTDETLQALSGAFRRATNAGLKVVFAAQGLAPDANNVAKELTPAAGIVDLASAGEANRQSTIGLSDLIRERPDGVVRRFLLRSPYRHRLLAVAAAELLGPLPADRTARWIRYYGPPGTVPSIRLSEIGAAAQESPSLFRDKVVFVGQGPPEDDPRLGRDQHRTPFSTSADRLSSGVEIHATVFANLMRNEWLIEASNWVEWAMALLVGVVSGVVFTAWPLRRVLLGIAALATTVFLASLLVFASAGFLLPWVILAGPQMAAALAVAFLPVKTAFVSYRRADGRNVAVFIANELNRWGVEAFLDIKTHSAGRLDGILFAQIARRRNLILVLTPGLVERWKAGKGPENDWIGQELERAMALGKTIIPVPVDDFGRFIERRGTDATPPVPAEVQHVLANYKRSSYSSDHPDASMAELARVLRSGIRPF